MASSPAPSCAHLSPRTPSRKLQRPHAPRLTAHEGSWTVGWPGLTGETSRSWAGCSPRPPPPQKTATLPALRSFQPTPLHAVNQEALQGDVASPFSLCTHRQARPAWTSSKPHVSSSLLGTENPGSGLDRPERSCPPRPRQSHRARRGGARCSGRHAAQLCYPASTPLRGPSHQVFIIAPPNSPRGQPQASGRASERVVCFCFQFLGVDFLKFPYNYTSYL